MHRIKGTAVAPTIETRLVHLSGLLFYYKSKVLYVSRHFATWKMSNQSGNLPKRMEDTATEAPSSHSKRGFRANQFRRGDRGGRGRGSAQSRESSQRPGNQESNSARVTRPVKTENRYLEPAKRSTKPSPKNNDPMYIDRCWWNGILCDKAGARWS